MLILARPSVSTYLTRTLSELQVPVILAERMAVPMAPALAQLTMDDLAADPRLAYRSLILTSSENALTHLYAVIPHDDRVMKSRLFKDKGAFRRAIARAFPQFYYRALPASDLAAVPAAEIPFPVVLKPATGISSIGVIRVATAAEWPDAIRFLQQDLAQYARNYAAHVVETQHVLIEKWIEGREFAIDGYYDDRAEPVVLNVMEHLFETAGDTSDRIYLTRKSIVRQVLGPIQEFLRKFGDLFDLKRFPFHLELRLTPAGELIPIELNPLRFSGLGTTEISQFAYGINVYEHFFLQKKPDWESILSREDDSVYSFMCADIPTPLFRRAGLQVLDRALFREFSEVLEYRLLSEEETSTFAVIFFRSEHTSEPERFLKMDFGRFLAEGAESAPGV